MSATDAPLTLSIASLILGAWAVLKIGFILFAIAYFLFSLAVVRQVYLMSRTLITETSPILRFLAISFALLSLGVLILFVVFI